MNIFSLFPIPKTLRLDGENLCVSRSTGSAAQHAQDKLLQELLFKPKPTTDQKEIVLSCFLESCKLAQEISYDAVCIFCTYVIERIEPDQDTYYADLALTLYSDVMNRASAEEKMPLIRPTDRTLIPTRRSSHLTLAPVSLGSQRYTHLKNEPANLHAQLFHNQWERQRLRDDFRSAEMCLNLKFAKIEDAILDAPCGDGEFEVRRADAERIVDALGSLKRKTELSCLQPAYKLISESLQLLDLVDDIEGGMYDSYRGLMLLTSLSWSNLTLLGQVCKQAPVNIARYCKAMCLDNLIGKYSGPGNDWFTRDGSPILCAIEPGKFEHVTSFLPCTAYRGARPVKYTRASVLKNVEATIKRREHWSCAVRSESESD